jgi:hypothetical protein
MPVLIIQNDFLVHRENGTPRIVECMWELRGTATKAKAPRIARGFEIPDDVCQTLIIINRAFELSRNFGVE